MWGFTIVLLFAAVVGIRAVLFLNAGRVVGSYLAGGVVRERGHWIAYGAPSKASIRRMPCKSIQS
jgi:hypothetical protein